MRANRDGPYCPAGNVPHAVVTYAGRTATLSTCSGATLTVIEASLPRSACAWAVTPHVPVPRAEVNTPAAVIVPHAAGTLHRTTVSLVPVTVAASCTGSQANAFTGETALMTTPLSTVTTAWALAVEFVVLVATT